MYNRWVFYYSHRRDGKTTEIPSGQSNLSKITELGFEPRAHGRQARGTSLNSRKPPRSAGREAEQPRLIAGVCCHAWEM